MLDFCCPLLAPIGNLELLVKTFPLVDISLLLLKLES